MVDFEGRIVLTNTRAGQLFGYTSEELLALGIEQLVPERFRARHMHHHEAFLHDPQERRMAGRELFALRKDGTEFPVEVGLNPLTTTEGQFILVSVVDITERQQAEVERQALLDIMLGAVAAADLGDFLRLVHNAIARVIYAENFDVILYNKDTGLFEEAYLVDQHDLPSPPHALAKGFSAYVFRTGQPLLLTQMRFAELVTRGEVELVGTASPSWLGVPLKTPRETIGVMAVQHYENPDCYSARDVDFLASIAGQVALAVERKRVEAELRQSEERYRQLVELSPDIIAVYSEDRLVYVNPAGIGLLGAASAEELVGRPMLEIIHPDDRAAVEERMCQSSVEGKILPLVVERLVRLDGETIHVEMAAIPFHLNGRPAAQIIARDISERRKSERLIRSLLEVTERRLKRMQALRNIDIAITSSLDLGMTLNVLLEQVLAQLSVDAAAVLLLNPYTQVLTYAAGRGFRATTVQHTRLRMGKSLAGRAAYERRTVNVPDLADDPDGAALASTLGGEDFVAYWGSPLVAKGQVKGVLEVFQRAPLTPDDEWVNFLQALAGQAAIAVDSASLFADLQHTNMELVVAYDATIEGWSHALDLRDRETEGHSQRVTEMTERLAQWMGIGDEEMVHIRRGALLHDIGKMGVPDKILHKTTALTRREWKIMQMHPQYALEMLQPIAYLRPALDIPYCHHEKWDGSGYPRRLKGNEIPLAARIFSVADVWDALTSDRPYRAALSRVQALEHMRDQSGKYFDPRVVETFFRLMQE